MVLTDQERKRRLFHPEPINMDEKGSMSLSVAMLFSIAAFVLVFLLLKAVITAWSMIFLSTFDIPFSYSIFRIYYLPVDPETWKDYHVFIIYGLNYILLIFASVGIFRLLHSGIYLKWMERLFLTWLVFVTPLFIIGSFVAGSIYYTELGYALRYLISTMKIRVLMGIMILVAFSLFSHMYKVLFIRLAFSRAQLAPEGHVRRFFFRMVVIPVITGIGIISLFELPRIAVFDKIILLGFLPSILIMLLKNSGPYNFKTYKFKKNQPTITALSIYILIGLLLLKAASLIKVEFYG